MSLFQYGCSDNLVEPEDSTKTFTRSFTQIAAPASDFTWTADGLTVTFANLSTEADRFLWDFGDGQQSKEENPVHVYTAAGDYQVMLTSSTSAGKLQSTRSVTVSDVVPPSPGEVPGPDTEESFPLDMGDAGDHTPGSYKGLPLRMTDTGEPTVTPLNDVIGVVCIGMSNSAQECDYFISEYLPTVTAEVNPQVQFVNCSKGGNAIERWIDPANDAKLWDKCVNSILPQAGITADQVKVIYHKAANMFTGPTPGVDIAYPPYPDPESDYFNFYDNLGSFAGRVKTFFPNIEAVYTTSRSYGGFTDRETRGEPLSYEEGHALNTWLSDNPTFDGVWHGWGPYIWAPDCVTGDVNGSGVCYVREDYQADAIHPGPGANEKISGMIHAWFSQYAWYSSS